MSGHSKWANIKRKKSATDAVKSRDFTKVARQIMVAVRQGGEDEIANVALRLAIKAGKAVNMPKETIDRSIKSALGDKGRELTAICYEIIAPFGGALIAVGSTDNPNRTASEIRHLVEKHGGKVVTPGAVMYLFTHCGLSELPLTIPEENVLKVAEQLNVFDLTSSEKSYELYFPFENLGEAVKLLEPYQTESIEICYKANQKVPVSNMEPINKLIVELFDHPDIDQVFSNYELK